MDAYACLKAGCPELSALGRRAEQGLDTGREDPDAKTPDAKSPGRVSLTLRSDSTDRSPWIMNGLRSGRSLNGFPRVADPACLAQTQGLVALPGVPSGGPAVGRVPWRF